MSNSVNNRGLGIIAAVIIMLIVAVMGLTVASLYSRNIGSSLNYVGSQQAFYLAESGVQMALLAIKNNQASPVSGTLGGGTYSADFQKISNSPEKWSINATGTIGLAQRKVVVSALRSSFFSKYAGFAGGSGGGSIAIDVGGTSLVNSYDSSKGLYDPITNSGHNGDLGTNSDIKIFGSGYVDGDIATGASGSCCASGYSGTVSRDTNIVLPPVVVPQELIDCTTNCTALASIPQDPASITGDYKITDTVSGKVSINGPARIYLTKSQSIKMVALDQITINATANNPVVFYVDGAVDVGGNGIVNTSLPYPVPSSFRIYATSNKDIKIGGGGDFFGLVYAPLATLQLSGKGEYSGSFIGNGLDITGISGLHHDDNIGAGSGPFPTEVTFWQPADWNETYTK